jgi:L-galactose dehydrogenase
MMQYGKLGRTDLEVAPVSFGTGSIGEFFGPMSVDESTRLVHEAIDLGVNFIDTSRHYGPAEERLGKALEGRRNDVLIGTKAGRYGGNNFDFSAAGVRRGIEESLRLLGTDHVDILQLHDIEFVDLDQVFGEGYEELVRLRDEGKTRYIGMTGYPLATMERAMTETRLDVLLTYAKGTLLDDSIREVLVPIADSQGVGLINAAAVSLGLLTPNGPRIVGGHPATPVIIAAAASIVERCQQLGVDPSFVANQYAIQRSGCVTTVFGVGKSGHLRSAIEAATTPIDDDLVAELIALRPQPAERQWLSGLPKNNRLASVL